MTTNRTPALIAAALVLALTAGCSATADPAPDAQATTATTTAPTVPQPVTADPALVADATLDELAALDAVTLVAALEATPVAQRRTDLRASVQPHAVLLSDATGEAEVAVPDGQHHLSVAPYLSSTHECFFHSLTTCTGELGGETVTVRIVDADSGAVYADGEVVLGENGFTGFWLPDGRTAEVTVTAEGREGTATVTTGTGDLTCLTSLRLA
jgi:hypothetical protein